MDLKEYSDKAIELIKGGYDLHVHTEPSHVARSLDDFEMARDADKVGMAGILIKSHYETTHARAMIANKYAGTRCKLYGAVTLNWPVGGINPYAAESSLKLGAKIVWMPTRDSENSLVFGDMPGDFFKRPGISIYDENMKIRDAVYEVLEVVKKYGSYLATGHLSAKESYDLCKEARKMGVNIILTHPDWVRTIVPLEQQIELSKLGVLIEKVWANIEEGTLTPEEMAIAVNRMGSENIFMVTDRGQANLDKPVEAMLKFIDCMLKQGVEEKAITDMVCNVPRSILE